MESGKPEIEEPTMRLRIESKDRITRVFDAETGKEIEHCIRAVFHHDSTTDEVRLEVTIADWSPEIEVHMKGEADSLDITSIADRCRKHKAVKFREFT
jgi:hypothetical protein